MRHITSITMSSILMACGVSGEFGKAQFEIGSAWDGTTPIAVGSEFPLKAYQGIWRESLEIKGCEEQILLSENIAKVHTAGSCTIMAMNGQGTLIDQISFFINTFK